MFADKLHKLQQREVSNIEALKALDSKCMMQNEEAAAEQRKLDELKSHSRKLPTEISSISEEVRSVKENFDVQSSMTNEKQNSLRCKRSELDKGLHSFRQHLGMSFSTAGDDRVRVVFTHIDAANPEREFRFDVSVAEESYSVENCVPHLPGLPALIADLTATNNFSNFVRSMRRSFKELSK